MRDGYGKSESNRNGFYCVGKKIFFFAWATLSLTFCLFSIQRQFSCGFKVSHIPPVPAEQLCTIKKKPQYISRKQGDPSRTVHSSTHFLKKRAGERRMDSFLESSHWRTFKISVNWAQYSDFPNTLFITTQIRNLRVYLYMYLHMYICTHTHIKC